MKKEIAEETVKMETGKGTKTMDTIPMPSKFIPLNGVPEPDTASDVNEDSGSTPQTPVKTPAKKHGSNATKEEAEGTPTKKRSVTKAKATKEPKTPKEKVVKEKKAAKLAARPIPQSFDEADEADRLLVEMKNNGASWKEIKDMWIEKTGQVPGGSTLSGRYSRIKDNLMHLKDGEAEILRQSAKEVESRFQTEKWSKIANEMRARGCEEYSSAFIQKQLKSIENKIAKGTYFPVAAVTATTENGVNGDEEADGEEQEDENEQKDGDNEEDIKAEDEQED